MATVQNTGMPRKTVLPVERLLLFSILTS